MKRTLITDESEVVRETLALVSRSAASGVQRLTASKLSWLIHGEFGCGQLEVVSAIQRQHPGLCLSVDVSAIGANYPAQMRQKLRPSADPDMAPRTLAIDKLDRCGAATQPQLLDFIAMAQPQCNNRCLRTSANADLSAVVVEANIRSQIEIDVSRPGTLAKTSRHGGARIGSVGHYLNDRSVRPEDSLRPHRVLLAQHPSRRRGPVRRGESHG